MDSESIISRKGSSSIMLIEKKQRKVAKHGVVTTLGFHEGDLVTVAKLDERTQIISLEPPERVEEMVTLLAKQPLSHDHRHSALMKRLQGKSTAPSALPRLTREIELDASLSEADADKFTHRARGRRSF